MSVVRTANEVISGGKVFGLVEWMDRAFGVLLSRPERLDTDSDTQDGVDDWSYWNGDGGRLG